VPLLNPDLICGICEHSYSNESAYLFHLAGQEHRLKLNEPAAKKKKGESMATCHLPTFAFAVMTAWPKSRVALSTLRSCE